MGWQDLLEEASSHLVAPWLGGRRIYSGDRSWRLPHRLPREFGWYLWEIKGRTASWLRKHDADPDYGNRLTKIKGYLIGDRLAPLGSSVRPDPDALFGETKSVYLVEDGLDRFTFVETMVDPYGRIIFSQELFPLGPEDEVRRAFIDRKETVDGVAGVPPALDLAFRFATRQRQLVEERRAELEQIRQEEERRERIRKNMGTGEGRRQIAAENPEEAARAALRVAGAELLDVRDGRTRREMIVQFRFENRRFECVAHKDTLRIVDSGICLTDHHTNEKGDTYFTLESLPGVIRQAIQEHKLVVYRHVDDDWDDDWED
jgi:hypothetical protein